MSIESEGHAAFDSQVGALNSPNVPTVVPPNMTIKPMVTLITTGQIIPVIHWRAMPEIRWVAYETRIESPRILQQLWLCSNGLQEWRDVTSVLGNLA